MSFQWNSYIQEFRDHAWLPSTPIAPSPNHFIVHFLPKKHCFWPQKALFCPKSSQKVCNSLQVLISQQNSTCKGLKFSSESKLFGKGPSRLRATSGTLVLVYLPNSSFWKQTICALTTFGCYLLINPLLWTKRRGRCLGEGKRSFKNKSETLYQIKTKFGGVGPDPPAGSTAVALRPLLGWWATVDGLLRPERAFQPEREPGTTWRPREPATRAIEATSRCRWFQSPAGRRRIPTSWTATKYQQFP